MPSPNPLSADDNLVGVAAAAANDVWAVGQYRDEKGNIVTLVEHWDGNMWSIVPSPNQSTFGDELNGVAALGTNDVWAVGTYYNVTRRMEQTLAEHWDGNIWTIVPSPNQGAPDDSTLNGVAAAGPGEVWAVGNCYFCTGNVQTLVERWDGNVWSIVPSPDQGTYLYGVAATGPGNVWAVGTYSGDGDTQSWWKGIIRVQMQPPPLHQRLNLPPAPNERFTDVCPGEYFYPYVQALTDDGSCTAMPCPPCRNCSVDTMLQPQ